jgi:ABC-type glycerol-3-phosphate transport system permease component
MKMNATMYWKFKDWILLGFLIVMACIFIAPLVWSTMTSFKPTNDMFSLPPDLWVAGKMGFHNYGTAFEDHEAHIAVLNSFAVTTLQVFFQLLVPALAAYPLATMRFPGRNLIFYGILATMMIPQFGMLVPAFRVVSSLKLINNYAGIVLPAAATPFGVFLLRQYYIRLPKDFFDAGIVDGANQFTLWFRVALPLAKPVLAALAIYSFIGSWKALLWPMLILQKKELFTLPIRLFFMISGYAQDYASLMAGATIGVVVPVVVFLFFQSQFIEGLSGGIKS